MKKNLDIIFLEKSKILCFFNEKTNRITKVKIPFRTNFLPTKKNLNFVFVGKLKIFLFENFQFWLLDQNLISKNQFFSKKKIGENKICHLEFKNGSKILFWRKNCEIIIFVEKNANFEAEFSKGFQNFSLEIQKFSKLFLTTTDTIVGIGCFYNNLDIELIFEIKKRPKEKKIVTLIGDLRQAKSIILPKNYQILKQISKNFWPGAVTLIIESKSFRIPNLAKLQQLLKKEGPAFVSSANFSGENPLNFQQAQIKFWQITKTYNFKSGSGTASKIFDIEGKNWIR
ncbi:Sua5/YciO/YrdC/YwlC family protein [Mycoplasma sp. 'Moose RK']|uniref:Sua5/YciO/YrdC/YwlC family protein n=1 Tax=Mycoplasma sp. 'Moose RK' TaxID=2780095 RepID=UPI0018C2D626|nr:Sua5/YciO/YrdC/YwlC family protein [Mycoplasma sp. 'Moose RK']MBG0730636.1 Sua5/YciO/YrdC/YwlC family protein [Mycoplasma sp. 'Moose RK']